MNKKIIILLLMPLLSGCDGQNKYGCSSVVTRKALLEQLKHSSIAQTDPQSMVQYIVSESEKESEINGIDFSVDTLRTTGKDSSNALKYCSAVVTAKVDARKLKELNDFYIPVSHRDVASGWKSIALNVNGNIFSSQINYSVKASEDKKYAIIDLGSHNNVVSGAALFATLDIAKPIMMKQQIEHIKQQQLEEQQQAQLQTQLQQQQQQKQQEELQAQLQAQQQTREQEALQSKLLAEQQARELADLKAKLASQQAANPSQPPQTSLPSPPPVAEINQPLPLPPEHSERQPYISDIAVNNARDSFITADRRLSDTWHKLGNEQQQKLLYEQRQWIKDKEAICGKISQKGSNAELIKIFQCQYDMTRKRIMQLQTIR